MTAWVLVAVLSSVGTYQSTATVQRFHTEASCKRAADIIASADRGIRIQRRIECIPDPAAPPSAIPPLQQAARHTAHPANDCRHHTGEAGR